jgi:hypothetical protein
MADIYVRSTDGNDADNGSTWALANATLVGAAADAVAGDTIYVSQNHAESQASAMTVTLPGTAASPNRVVCGNDAAEPPTAVAATGTITTTGGSAMTINGSAYFVGLSFSCGTGATGQALSLLTSGAGFQVYDNCSFSIPATSSPTIRITIDSVAVAQHVRWLDCDVSFAATGSKIQIGAGRFEWFAGALLAGTAVPTALITFQSRGGSAVLRGVDLSQIGSGKSVVDVSTMVGDSFVIIENCKLGSSGAFTTGSFAAPGPRVEVVNCDSADTNYRYCYKDYQGEITHETTIVRTGGASDGTTPISRKMVSTANSKFYLPLVLDSIVIWNDTTGSSKTVTIEVVSDNVTFTDAELWIEVEYLGTSGFPVSSFASDRAADILATAANQTTSSVDWTTTGLTTPVKQKLAVSFTPQEKGPFRVRVMLAKASSTVYVDPLPTVS